MASFGRRIDSCRAVGVEVSQRDEGCVFSGVHQAQHRFQGSGRSGEAKFAAFLHEVSSCFWVLAWKANHTVSLVLQSFALSKDDTLETG